MPQKWLLLGTKLFYKLVLNLTHFFFHLESSNYSPGPCNENILYVYLKKMHYVKSIWPVFIFSTFLPLDRTVFRAATGRRVLWTLLNPAELFSFVKDLQHTAVLLFVFPLRKWLLINTCLKYRIHFSRFDDHFMANPLEINTCPSPKVILPGGTINVKVFYQHYNDCSFYITLW